MKIFILIVKTFIFIIPLSYLISYILFQSLNGSFVTKMISPFYELIICFCTIIIVVYYSLIFNFNKIKRKSLINMLNNDNG